jgi:hypothetical protein
MAEGDFVRNLIPHSVFGCNLLYLCADILSHTKN